MGSHNGSVGRGGDNRGMTDDGGGLHVRQAPRKRTGEISVADFTMLVRAPGQPAAVRVHTEDERDEAVRYAAEVGGVVVPLPLPVPKGYAPGPNGSVVPVASPERSRAPATADGST